MKQPEGMSHFETIFPGVSPGFDAAKGSQANVLVQFTGCFILGNLWLMVLDSGVFVAQICDANRFSLR